MAHENYDRPHKMQKNEEEDCIKSHSNSTPIHCLSYTALDGV